MLAMVVAALWCSAKYGEATDLPVWPAGAAVFLTLCRTAFVWALHDLKHDRWAEALMAVGGYLVMVPGVIATASYFVVRAGRKTRGARVVRVMD